MSEYEVALRKVLPYLREKLCWPRQLLSAYGRVPVQVGGSTVWADFVCYMSRDQKPVPWLLVEVKQPGVSLQQEALPQAESYSLILGCPYFCITDGDRFVFFATGNSQGKSTALQGSPAIPSLEFLPEEVEYVSFPPLVDALVDLFLIGLEEEDRFLDDTRLHEENIRQLHQRAFQRIDSLSATELKDVLSERVMMKRPNRNLILRQVDQDIGKFKEVLKFIRDFHGDPVINISQLMQVTGDLHIKGGGIFFITQLLAGSHPNDYVVLEENVSKALRYLGVTDILVKNDTANGYVYINEICKKLFKDKLKCRLEKYGFGLAAVHNFLWHYYVHYRLKKKWFP